MYEKSFKLLTFGTIFSTISYPVTKYDFRILPSFLGYILFFIAFIKLKQESLHFKKSMHFVLCIIPIAFFSFFHKYVMFRMELNIPKGLTLSLNAVQYILYIIIIFHVFMGIEEIAENKEEVAIKDKSEKLWQMNVKLMVLSFIYPLLILLPILGIIGLLGLLIYSLYITIKTILLFNECAKKFN